MAVPPVSKEIVPDFSAWDMREVKDLTIKSALKSLARGGTPALAVLLSILAVTYMTVRAIDSGMDTNSKAMCTVLSAFGLLVVAGFSIQTSRSSHAATCQRGQQGPAEPGGECGDE